MACECCHVSGMLVHHNHNWMSRFHVSFVECFTLYGHMKELDSERYSSLHHMDDNLGFEVWLCLYLCVVKHSKKLLSARKNSTSKELPSAKSSHLDSTHSYPHNQQESSYFNVILT